MARKNSTATPAQDSAEDLEEARHVFLYGMGRLRADEDQKAVQLRRSMFLPALRPRSQPPPRAPRVRMPKAERLL